MELSSYSAVEPSCSAVTPSCSTATPSCSAATSSSFTSRSSRSTVLPSTSSAVSCTANESDDENMHQILNEISSQSFSFSDSSSQDPSYVQKKSVEEKDKLECVQMPFSRVIATHKYCFICGSKKNIISVPLDARKQTFMKRKIFIPKGNRCCSSHLINKRFYEEELQNLRIILNVSCIDVEER